ncbi:cell division protein ZapE [Sulfuricella sp. T08]|uniref:cell division protein ZapE n=1 Tax=Sulfuricella sp. T08 TaxID=1632857 RepID=UPI000750ABC6|nr:cell division protein ZapE [Sulfuricella sp. T08]
MNLAECVHQRACQHDIVLDEAQQHAVDRLQHLYYALLESEVRKNRFLHKLFGRKQHHVRGLYLWGGVGRGKSFLMDVFFSSVPLEQKKRVHFHRFMQDVHAELDTIKHHADPLVIVAQRIAQQARLICFDEFHVSDIADAMLLGRLLRELLQQGVVLVATSNHKPDELYMHGLQRSRFLPAIALLKERLDVVEIDAGIDYRLRMLERVRAYHFPLDEVAEASLGTAFSSLAGGEGASHVSLKIEGRRISTKRSAPGVVWFDFQTICGAPRGQADYIEIARRFHTVLISGIPKMSPEQAAEARRFTWLVDEFYDRRVKLIVSAQVPPQELYPGGPHAEEFHRTISRLTEMQSRQYLAQPHLP